MKKYLMMIALAATLYSCHKDDDDPVDKRAQRTVLVYMAAENNLMRFASDDLEEMMLGSLSLKEDQNLIVYVDKANSSTTPYLARVVNGELRDTLYMKEGLAADPTILEQTLKSAMELYPAKSYGLVLWGHASGWLISKSDSISAASRAYGGSTGNGSSFGSGKYWMNIPNMAKAIANALGDQKLKFILGDCCSFGCVEVAYELRNLTEYVIGSPAEVPDMGAPFDLTVPDMFSESDLFYQQMIDHYYNYYLTVYDEQGSRYYNRFTGDLKGYSVPLAAIKTDELDNLASATSTLLNTIKDKVSQGGSMDFDKVMFYAIYSNYPYSLDICDMLKRNATKEAFDRWYPVFEKTVPYRKYSAKWMTNSSQLAYNMDDFTATADNCGCISMFFPDDSYADTDTQWNKAIQQYQWNNVIRWEQYGW